MIPDFGLVGNGEMLARVRADGTMTEAYYPSIGFFRHIIQSQFGVYHKDRDECLWFSAPDFQIEQRYLEDTNVLATTFTRPHLWAQIVDFIHPDLTSAVRTLEVRNTGSSTVHLSLFHAEASSVEDHKGQFGYNVAYFNRLGYHAVRYRGHPWDNAVESQVCWLIGGFPEPASFQCGVSYEEHGAHLDAFVDVRDGKLHENRYAFGDPTGTTTALMWNRDLKPGESTKVSVYFVPGMSLFDAEDSLEKVQARHPDQLQGDTVGYWRKWLATGKKSLPALDNPRLEALYLRSILLLKLLQDRKYGSFIAAPTLEPDYRYCWPRDAVYEAWALDSCGYHAEARHFYRWCQRTQMWDGVWYQNHYTDGRRHWAGLQVDQIPSVIWGAWEHFQLTGDHTFLVDMWPTIERAAEFVVKGVDPKLGLVHTEQDLWEETGGYLSYTNASCVAGLWAASRIAREVGQETDSVRWREAADRLKKQIYAHFLQDGVFVGDHQPKRKFHMRADYRLDISNIGLAVPYGVIPADSPEMVRTVQEIEEEVDYPIDGVGRYASDLFVGGNPWSLSAIWLALYFVETGDIAEVHRHLDWCLRHAMLHDFLPEQSNKQTGAPCSAAPLGWSHAWIIILLQKLGRRMRTAPDLWPEPEVARTTPP